MNNSCLEHNQNWSERAREAQWSASALAKLCGITVRTLHRYFLKQMGVNPKIWLAEQRQKEAMNLLRDGSSIKETATALGYKEPGSFIRRCKNQMGICPSLPANTIAPPSRDCPQMIDNVRT